MRERITGLFIPAECLPGMDGYTNAAAGLGEASPLTAAATFVRSGLSRDTEKLTAAYRGNYIAKRIIDGPSEDATREWYTLSVPSMGEEDLRQLKKLEAKHSVKQEITDAIRWARLYGGSIAIMITYGDQDRMDTRLDPKRLRPGCFMGLLVVDMTQEITPSLEMEDDLDDPEYGLPEYYEVSVAGKQGENRRMKIHHSRVLRFTGRELPREEMIRNDYWGASELEHVWDALIRHDSGSENTARMTYMSNLVTLKMGSLGADLAYGSDRTKESAIRAVEEENRLRSSYGTQLLSEGDSMETHPYNFGGLAEILDIFMMDVAGAAEMPCTKIFGRSPQGMNATGRSDEKNYSDMVGRLQERILRPALEKLLPVMAVSCWGMIPEDMEIRFNPLVTMSPGERAELARQAAEEIRILLECGVITAEEAREKIKAPETGGNGWGTIL